MSKGSTPRPFNVTNQEYANRWDAIFGRDNEQKKNEEKALEFDRSSDARHNGRSDNPEGQTGQTQNA